MSCIYNISKLCSRCGSQGLRHNRRFVCSKCGVEFNADYNGTLNILKRALGYISRVGAGLTQPRTPMKLAPGQVALKGAKGKGESPDFSRGECQNPNTPAEILVGVKSVNEVEKCKRN